MNQDDDLPPDLVETTEPNVEPTVTPKETTTQEEEEKNIPKLIPSTSEPSALQKEQHNPVPVTIVTGFLGSGKTTLITRLLTDNTHGKRIAVILNEFGDSTVFVALFSTPSSNLS
jgi:polynucleotide 5'-kinase involved in rRNA processing